MKCEECNRPIGEKMGPLCHSCEDEVILADILPRTGLERDPVDGHWLDLVDMLVTA